MWNPCLLYTKFYHLLKSDLNSFKSLFKDEEFGVQINYAVQDSPFGDSTWNLFFCLDTNNYGKFI